MTTDKRDFYHLEDLQHLQNLSGTVRFASDIAAYNGDFESVAQFEADVRERANAVRRCGLIVDCLDSVAVSGVGIGGLRSARDRYDDNIRRDLIARLCRQDNEREPFAEITRRDAKWGPDRTDCGVRIGSWRDVSHEGFDLYLDADDFMPSE